MTQLSEQAITRREALRRAALLFGGTLSAPAIAGVLAGCDSSTPDATDWTPRATTQPQSELIASIAERIIPETKTPGARTAQVHRFIDTMLAEYYTPAERNDFLIGLADVDARAERAHGRDFVRCSTGDQHAIIDQIDRQTFAAGATSAPSFFRTMKELTVLGYYTSQVGATRELHHVQVPGRYDSCVPLSTIGSAWVD
jgi:gluconate 2-dehydrogenase gamma chain